MEGREETRLGYGKGSRLEDREGPRVAQRQGNLE